MEQYAVPKPKGPARKAKILGSGPDGRNIYTADPDARAGDPSATNSRPAGRTSATSCTSPSRPRT